MTGTECKHCSGWLVQYASKRQGERTVRYFACWLCSHKPECNKTVTADDHPNQRQRRRVRT